MTVVYLWIIVVAWITIGLVVGSASHYSPLGSDSGGWLTNAGFGVLGALVGGIVGAIAAGGTKWPSHFAIAGAIGCVLLWRLYHARRQRD